MGTWALGHLGLWALGLMDTWAHGHLGSWTVGLLVSWAHGHLGSWAHGILGSWASWAILQKLTFFINTKLERLEDGIQLENCFMWFST
jgi:hypothetical protein